MPCEGKENALGPKVMDHVSREGGGLQQGERALRASVGFPWREGWPVSLLINCVSNHSAYDTQTPQGESYLKMNPHSFPSTIHLSGRKANTNVSVLGGKRKDKAAVASLALKSCDLGAVVFGCCSFCFIWEPVSLKGKETTEWTESTPTHHENLCELLLQLRWKFSCFNSFSLS